jgi:hypothetical protein
MMRWAMSSTLLYFLTLESLVRLTYLLFLKERGFLNASLGCAIEIVLPSLDVRLKSPNALWRLSKV